MSSNVLSGTELVWVGEPAALLCLPRPATIRHTLLMVSPFAEEQGRCRRLQFGISKALGEHGISCCWLDLPGTGDSPVDETDITAALWLAALENGADWLRRNAMPAIAIGGLRLGGVVALHWAKDRPSQSVFALEPVDGASMLRTMLRTVMIQTGQRVDKSLELISNGQIVEAAGFPISSNTRATLEHFTLSDSLSENAAIIQSDLTDIPPWLQMEPAECRVLVDQHAARLRQLCESAAS